MKLASNYSTTAFCKGSTNTGVPISRSFVGHLTSQRSGRRCWWPGTKGMSSSNQKDGDFLSESHCWAHRFFQLDRCFNTFNRRFLGRFFLLKIIPQIPSKSKIFWEFESDRHKMINHITPSEDLVRVTLTVFCTATFMGPPCWLLTQVCVYQFSESPMLEVGHPLKAS